jgi:hypothetical protein
MRGEGSGGDARPLRLFPPPVSRPAFLVAVLLAALLAPGHARAHAGGEPLIIVPLDHVTPGQSFPVTAADLGPWSLVSFRIVKSDRSVPLGRRRAGPDGHFQTSLVLPAAFPDGYAQLIAKGSDGSAAATWILVGGRTESTPSPPGQTVWWKHPMLVLLLLVLVGGGGAALVLTVRRFGSSR